MTPRPVPPARRTRLRKTLFAATTLVLALGAGGLVLETALRLASPDDEHGRLRILTPVYHHGLRARVRREAGWGDRRFPYRTDSLGFRDADTREVPLSLSPGAARVLFLGDSFTEGVGVPWEDTFVARFEHETGRPSLDAGVVSHCPLLELLRLRDLLARGLTCTEVVLFLDPSDLQDELVYHAMVRKDAGGEPLDFRSWRSNAVTARLYNDSALVRFVYLRGRRLLGIDDESARRALSAKTAPGHAPTLGRPGDPRQMGAGPSPTTTAADKHLYAERALWTEDPELFERWGRRGFALAREDLVRIRDLCRSHGIRFTLVVYPWPQQLQSTHDPSLAETLFRDLAGELGIGFIDLFPAFREHPRWESLYIEGDVHWNREGHALVAHALAQALVPGTPASAPTPPPPPPPPPTPPPLPPSPHEAPASMDPASP